MMRSRTFRTANPGWAREWARARAGLVLTLVVVILAGARPAWADKAAEHYNLGLQLKRDGKVVEAIAEVEKAIAARPRLGS